MTNEVELKEHDDDSVNGDHHDDGRSNSFEIIILYNGLEKPLTVSKSDLISDVLKRAIELFGVPANPAHMLGLFTTDKGELELTQTVKEAGIKKREKVLLRPSTVRAG